LIRTEARTYFEHGGRFYDRYARIDPRRHIILSSALQPQLSWLEEQLSDLLKAELHRNERRGTFDLEDPTEPMDMK